MPFLWERACPANTGEAGAMDPYQARFCSADQLAYH